jgi:very-short-patch-repair endonuclease
VDNLAGIGQRSGLLAGESSLVSGLPVTTLPRTVADLVPALALDDLVCLLDSAMRIGWVPDPGSPRSQRKLRAALALTDRRSESPFETRLRIRLVLADLAPETLQFELFTAGGRVYARLDMAWPSVKLAVEADGRETHDAPLALYHDRVRANDVELEGWTILRFTWADLYKGPDWIESQVRRALDPGFVAIRAS